MAQSYAWLREAGGHGETDAFAASEAFVDRGYDAVVALTRSGTTTEVLDLVERLRGRVRTVGVIGDPTSPLVDLVDDAVTLPFADERSVVQTRFATTALALFRASLGEDLDGGGRRRPDARSPRSSTPRSSTPSSSRSSAAAGPSASPTRRRSRCARPRSRGPSRTPRWSTGTAPSRSRRRAGSPGTSATSPAGLADEVAATGARFEAGALDPMAELVRAQRVALARALARGLDPDSPRNLTRSVILGRLTAMTATPDAAPAPLGPGEVVLAFDVGGTDTKSAIVDADGRVLGLRRTPTPLDGDRTAEAVVGLVAELAAELRAAHPGLQPVAAGLLVPGIVDAERGVGVYASNLGWHDAPIRDLAEAALGLPVAFHHDVTAASWAEHRLGAARAYDDVVVLVIGTGIAGSLILDGRPHLGGGYAGEIGHSPVADGPRVPAVRGDASRPSPRPAPSPGATPSAPGVEVDGAREVLARAEAGDADARAVWESAVDALGVRRGAARRDGRPRGDRDRRRASPAPATRCSPRSRRA